MEESKHILVVGGGAKCDYFQLLESAGYSVETAETNEEAEEKLASGDYELVVKASEAAQCGPLQGVVSNLADRLSEERRFLALMLDNTPEAISYLDADLIYRHCNSAAAEQLGRPMDRIIGQRLDDIVGVDSPIYEAARSVLRTGKPHASEIRVTLPDRPELGEIDQLVSFIPDMDASGKVRGIFASGRDITERKRTEEALRASEERLRKAMSIETVGALFFNLKGHIHEANAAFERWSGYSSEELRRITHWEHLTAPEFHEATKRTAHELATRGKVAPYEKQMFRKDGSRWWGLFAPTLLSGSGYDSECMEFIIDITERKQAEDALRSSEERLKRAQEIAHLGSWELDLAQNRLTWSDEVYRIFGLKPQEFAATYEAFLEAVHPDDRAAVDEAYAGSLREGRDTYEIEHRVVRKHTGEIRIVHEKCEHIRDASGKIVRSIGMVHDITKRKQAEDALQKAREDAERRAAEMESFLTSIVDGVTVVDGQGRIVFLNKEGRKLLGIPEGENLQTWLDFTRITLDGRVLHPSETAVMRALHGEVVKDLVYRWLLPWKEVTINVNASPVMDSEGRIIGATNTFRDVTERVEFERLQQELFEREKHIADTLQKALVPETPYQPECCTAGIRYEAAYREADIGGDFYDIFDMGDGRVGVLIGDVAGKGLGAAIRVSAARHAIRSYAYIDPRPSRVMTLANDALCKEENGESGLLTAFFAVIDTRVGMLSYSNGGHETPLLHTADSSVEELNVPGRALGVMCGFDYPEHSRRLMSGDTMVMVTDGITEARQTSSDLFGIDGVKRYLRQSAATAGSADELADGLLDDAKSHGGGNLRDDAAVVVIRWNDGTGHVTEGAGGQGPGAGQPPPTPPCQGGEILPHPNPLPPGEREQ